jgi:hypothetical protein
VTLHGIEYPETFASTRQQEQAVQSRPDVMVEAEQILRVVFPFQLNQALIMIRRIGGAGAVVANISVA